MSKENKHFPVLIAISFISCFIFGIAGGIFKETNLNAATAIWQLSNMFYVAGCALLSLKAGSESRHISATGFILLSIGTGTFFSLQTTVSLDTAPVYASGILILLPGLVFVSYYDVFPVWVRVAGIVAGMPRLIMLIDLYMNDFKIERNGALDGIGYFLMNLVGLLWVYYTFSNTNKFKPEEREE